MTFYSNMAWYYEEIFPVAQTKVNFVRKRMETFSDVKLLDIGCATGQFPYVLAKETPSIESIDAFDLDDEMITLAKERYPSEQVNYQQGNMLNLDNLYSSTYNMITCFGNTLVHIGDEKIPDLFRAIYEKLSEGGIFILQLLNYDYVMSNKVFELPLIETERLIFQRRYEDVKPQSLTFVTSLSLKDTKETVEGRIPLYPLYKEAVVQALQNNGFTDINCYKDYMEKPYDGEGLPLIITAVK